MGIQCDTSGEFLRGLRYVNEQVKGITVVNVLYMSNIIVILSLKTKLCYVE